ncbi:MAG TPA: glycosyltransferase family 4 protein [Chloroflexota bacterium]|nr:glycosyltransferase family 4 protein [Chloroflexota bacterium]
MSRRAPTALPSAPAEPVAPQPTAASAPRGHGTSHTAAGCRVLTIAPTPFFGDYGCHVRILEEMRALQAAGHRPTLYTYPYGRAVADVVVRRTPRPPGRWHARPGSSRHKLYLDALLGATALRGLGRTRPDVVHGHLHEGAFIGYPLSRLARAPLVFDFQGSLTAEMVDHGFLRPASRWYGPMRRLEAAINRLADAVVTSTRHAADLLVREFGCPARRITVVPDGVNVARFAPAAPGSARAARVAALRGRLGLPPGAPVVVYLGLLAEYQGLSLLLQAARRVLAAEPDVYFLLLGYPGQAYYSAQAAALDIGARVVLPGRVPYEQAPDYLALGTVAVAPKVSATEGNGKVLNYMAMALPVVAFDAPVNRELLGDLGLYAPLGDVGALGDALLAALRDPGAARACGQALRARAAAHLSWDAAAARLDAVYRRLVTA